MQEIINCYSILSFSLSREKGQGLTSPNQTHLVTPLENFVSIDSIKRVIIMKYFTKNSNESINITEKKICHFPLLAKQLVFSKRYSNVTSFFFENNFDDISFSIIFCQLFLLEKTDDSKIELFKKMVEVFRLVLQLEK